MKYTNKTMKIRDIEEKYVLSHSDGRIYIDIKAPVFEFGGIRPPEHNCGEYYRLDASQKGIYSDSNRALAECTAGATVRFCTDADSLLINVNMRSAITGMRHFADRGAYGFDFYTGTGENREYCGNMMQMFTNPESFAETLTLTGKRDNGILEVMAELPLYGGVERMNIGFPEDAEVSLPSPRDMNPIAFYGSSITQGGCVSRPGNMYSNIICRELDCDNINLGFSGSALGEQSVAEYICTRDISAFVMDYDYNSDPARLRNTHEAFYRKVREKHKDIPVVFVTHPYYPGANDEDRDRIATVYATYERAKAVGERVAFVHSEDLFPKKMRDLCAVDNLHPNSLGHYFMAEAILKALRSIM